MKFTLWIIFVLGYTSISYAQSTDTLQPVVHFNIFEELNQNCPQNGYVNINGVPEINELVNLHTALNKANKHITGYRIQIFSGSSYDHSIEELQLFKENFEKEFPEIPAYLNYFDPDFKIRVGNFKNRLDCIPALKKIRRKYPSCYPVKTEIPISDLDRLSQKNNRPEEISTEKTSEIQEE